MPEENKQSVSYYEVLAKALLVNYESIYDIDLETFSYHVYHESEAYRKLKLSKSGANFFDMLQGGIRKVITPEDQPYVAQMLSKEALLEGVQAEDYYVVVYRIEHEGRQIYHKLRATQKEINGKKHILMGVRNIDTVIRQEIAHREVLASMKQKENNYLDAVLSTAVAYIDANLTTDRVLDKSIYQPVEQYRLSMEVPSISEIPTYSGLQKWRVENIVCDNKERYEQISSRDFLLESFAMGDRRASVLFSICLASGGVLPCREVFFLYQERATEDIHVLCVIYDLTEQQKQEQEMEKLEMELQLSRIRNSTSQMQPHFLYNALGSIQEVILTDPEYAARLLEDFTIHLRSCIRAMNSDDPIPFAQELDNIRAYVSIEKMRFGSKLKIHYEIGTINFSILPLCIQPLVENAIRHGIYKKGPAGGTVTLRTKKEEDAIVVQVEDDGIGFDVEQLEQDLRDGTRDSTGLKNIRFRLEKVMNADVVVESTIGTGTIVTVRVPREVSQHASNNSR